MDVLSNVLSATNLATHAVDRREFVPPWGIYVEAQPYGAAHIVKQGTCWLQRRDGELLELTAGDIVLLATGDAHCLSSDPAMRDLEPRSEALARSEGHVVPPRRGVADLSGEPTILQSARYEVSQDSAHPLLSVLPPIIRVPASDAKGNPELRTLLQLIEQEIGRHEAGSELVVPRLIDALFVYILRGWLRRQPEGACGWLGALRDPQIRKALSQIHEAPQAPWTVESLARSVAMSRAVFAKRFNDLVGEPPLAYVTRRRMDLAAKLLRESAEPVARIAGRVGYVSETAFAKAFRRRRKIAPGQYRYGGSKGAGDVLLTT